MAIITLCEDYMGIEPHINLWNYFFRIWLQQGSSVEAAVWGYVDRAVRSEQGIDPYFCLSISNHLVGWQRKCFFLRNDANAPLLAFTCNRAAPQPSMGYGVAQWDIRKLQPLCKVVQQLQQARLIGTDLLRTFVSRRTPPLRQREETMWMYPRPSCPDYSFSVELYNAEIDIRNQRIFALGAHQNSGPSPISLREGVVIPW
jgi:hypothetical protein